MRILSCLKSVLPLIFLWAVSGCSFFNSFSECEENRDCGDKGICVEGGVCVEINLKIDECIGVKASSEVNGSCRSSLESLGQNYEDSTGGCFFLHTNKYSPRYTSFEWREGEIYLRDLDPVLIDGAQFNTHLYFLTRSTDEELDCSIYLETLALSCSDSRDCVLKLTSDAQVFNNREISVSYLREEDQCAASVNTTYLSVEGMDMVDNDCDGVIDESSQSCVIGMGVCQSDGFYYRSSTGEKICNATPIEPGVELCEGMYDEDCDGRVDEGFESVGTACSPEAGSGSLQTGLYECSFDRLNIVCQEAGDYCDGVDQDQDGSVDEDHLTEEVVCPDGSCSPMGLVRCVNGQITNTCSSTSSSSDDQDPCDGIDNDCDGRVDEDAPVEATTCGSGPCEGAGQLSCVDGRMVDSCMPNRPAEELCDDRDNDCDGRIDEVPECDECENRSEEICDGSDNDCDGMIDEGVMSPCGSCDRWPIDEIYCDGIDNDCDGQADESPPEESCDPIDNDCDGLIDEGIANCPQQTLDACRTTLTWTDEDNAGTSQLLISQSGLSPLVPAWAEMDAIHPDRDDEISLSISCDNQGWGQWINEHCGAALVVSDRGSRDEYRSQDLNPRTCVEGGRNNINTRCISTHIDRSITLSNDYDRFGFRFDCPAETLNSEEDRAVATHLNSLYRYQIRKLEGDSGDNGDCLQAPDVCEDCTGQNEGSTYYVENLDQCDALYFGVEFLTP